jgi:CMP-N-acetylneuraminic acid synthetase
MIFWAIDVAYNSGLFHKIVVSTEDDEIAEVSKRAGAEILTRPPCLAEDSIGTQDVAKHALETRARERVYESFGRVQVCLCYLSLCSIGGITRSY